ncbi:hypothetical protein [Nitrosopumilus sp. b2]|uniref:hypothetical protein n=1 Tax=Nitrosopumilus sp. b2 TaxID=2109908 RepID=UPI0015F6138A|nr:hypothetical protein [Nitrosopumilus sp. b2]KAF6245468.1 hypothetical protein C6989_03295 [Nitrosopumilus sp. b2]
MSSSRPKSKKYETQKQSELKQRILHMIWVCESFHFPIELSLRYINSGILGNKTNSKGVSMTDKNTGKAIPITISRSTYYRYKKETQELSEFYQYLRDFVSMGFLKMMIGFQHELAYLHKLSAENLLATKNPSERQHIIDSMVTKVLPTQSAFADILRDMSEEHFLQKSSEYN